MRACGGGIRFRSRREQADALNGEEADDGTNLMLPSFFMLTKTDKPVWDQASQSHKKERGIADLPPDGRRNIAARRITQSWPGSKA